MKPPPEAAPAPPTDLAARIPLETIVEIGELLHRFYTAAFDPIYFDRGHDGRLNAPDGTTECYTRQKPLKALSPKPFCGPPA